MVTNTDITLYKRIRSADRDAFKRIYIEKAWMHEYIQDTLTTDGTKKGTDSTNIVTIRIPDMSVYVDEGDLVIKGKGVDIESVKDLKKYHVVTYAHRNEHGHNMHTKVKAL